jgi:hypothetical protein
MTRILSKYTVEQKLKEAESVLDKANAYGPAQYSKEMAYQLVDIIAICRELIDDIKLRNTTILHIPAGSGIQVEK